jgi:DNA-directed RNA polymerase specialized sigma24 family protein
LGEANFMADDDPITSPAEAAFKACLGFFDPDPEEAAAKWEQVRAKLISFFRNRQTRFPEDDADLTMDRVCGKILSGEPIRNISAYSLTVARYIYKEGLRDPQRGPRTDAGVTSLADRGEQDNDHEYLDCLDGCLDKLERDQRDLILTYYSGDGREKIEQRKKLAQRLGVPINTLRLRAFRLRDWLGGCIRNCLESGTAGDREFKD